MASGSVEYEPGLKIETNDVGTVIRWQDAPRGETGGELIGDTPETILPSVIARLRSLNREPNTPSRETALAITHCEEALHWLEARRRDRDARAVTGTYAT